MFEVSSESDSVGVCVDALDYCASLCLLFLSVQVRRRSSVLRVLAFVLRSLAAGVVWTVFVLFFAVAMLCLSLRGFGGKGCRVLRLTLVVFFSVAVVRR